ncbi:hypothetical protein ACLOJK_032280 [Asimina triloba]
MAPRSTTDKGKAPMVEDEPRSTRSVTRSRRVRIVIREVREVEHIVETLVHETSMTEEEEKVELRMDEALNAGTVQAKEVERRHDVGVATLYGDEVTTSNILIPRSIERARNTSRGTREKT